MNISLTPELEQYIHERVASGLYNNASEVVRECLRTFKEYDDFRQKVQASIARYVANPEATVDGPAAMAEIQAKLAGRKKTATA